MNLLQAKHHVVIDFSFWQRQRRNDYKQLIEEHGGDWELIFLKVGPDELRQRLLIRVNVLTQMPHFRLLRTY